jgi:hypothetical protein
MKAFPSIESPLESENNRVFPISAGMELRDYFAAKALNAFLLKLNENYVMSDAAFDAYCVADEMMVAREK